jgi:hypothetical protein
MTDQQEQQPDKIEELDCGCKNHYYGEKKATAPCKGCATLTIGNHLMTIANSLAGIASVLIAAGTKDSVDRANSKKASEQREFEAIRNKIAPTLRKV